MGEIFFCVFSLKITLTIPHFLQHPVARKLMASSKNTDGWRSSANGPKEMLGCNMPTKSDDSILNMPTFFEETCALGFKRPHLTVVFFLAPCMLFFVEEGLKAIVCDRVPGKYIPSLEHPRRGSFTGQYCSICNLNEDEPSP